MKQRLWLLFFCLCITLTTLAQTTEVRGTVVDRLTLSPIPNATVRLIEGGATATANEHGAFVIRTSETGSNVLMITGAEIITSELPVSIPMQGVLELEYVLVQQFGGFDMSLMGIIDESTLDLDDGDGMMQDIDASLVFSNDVFLRNAGFQFSQFRFRVRGYGSQNRQISINGVNFNDQIRGGFNHASLGALNDVTRNRDVMNHFAPSTFGFGAIGGSENINMRAGSFTRNNRVTASLTNRTYYARLIASHTTGMREDGWAFTFAAGARYSHEGAVAGTFYRNIAYQFGAERVFGDNRQHSLSFVTFGSPVERGQQGTSLLEAFQLTGNNQYNPNWGYQDGRRRNARVVRAFNPTAVFSHIWRANEHTTLTTGLGMHYNRSGNSALGWFDGADPRPDNWRNLPSNFRDNPTAFEYYTFLWTQCRRRGEHHISQINWDRLWEVNRLNNIEGDGSAIFIVEERRNDMFETNFNSTINTRLSDNVRFTAGVGARSTLNMQFNTVKDLLGANHLLDVNKFAERDFPGNHDVAHNDLNRPDRRVYEGDRFGYDFRFRVNSANLWFQQVHTYRHIDFHLGATMRYTTMQREGLMRNGRHPDNSYGRGVRHNFVDFGINSGIVYKITGRHFLTANLSYQTHAPMVGDLYISPRVMDRAISNPQSMGVLSADINYIFSMPSVRGRISLFNTHFHNEKMSVVYFHDGARTLVNHVLEGLNRTHRGIEVGVNYRLNSNWNFDFIGTTGQFFYTNNPMGTISFENGAEPDFSEKVYMQNLRVGGMPQTVGTIGVNFFHNFWFVNANLNGFMRNFIVAAPVRRLASNYYGIQPPGTDGFDEQAYNAFRWLTTQEEFDGGMTADLSIGRIIFTQNRNQINFRFSVNNIFNNQNVRLTGMEQARISFTDPERFNSRYLFMQGINGRVNVTYRF